MDRRAAAIIFLRNIQTLTNKDEAVKDLANSLWRTKLMEAWLGTNFQGTDLGSRGQGTEERG